MYLLAFDRDWTVDVNPHPDREAVPLAWVRHWAHETDHAVWAIGNQDLVAEADIPGTVESIRRRDGDIEALGERNEFGRYEHWPTREERLHILADLFPEADRRIVVDDLDLSRVEGWEHYHAWEFVPLVRDGEIDLPLPATPDGGYTPAAVEETRENGLLFELTTPDRGTEIVAREPEPRRPAAKPLTDEPLAWFRSMAGDRFYVRVDEITSLEPVDAEELPDPMVATGMAGLAAVLQAGDGGTGDLQVIDWSLMHSHGSETRREPAIELAWAAHERFDPLPVRLSCELVDLLEEAGIQRVDPTLLQELAAEDRDDDVLTDHGAALARLATVACTRLARHAANSLSTVAETDPSAVLDGVPVVATAAESDDRFVRRHAVYTCSKVAAEYPAHVAPARPQLVAAMRSRDDNLRTNATTALGRIAANYPDAVSDVVEDVAALLEGERAMVRANAVGLLGDVAQTRQDAVAPHLPEMARLLEDEDEQTRINASIALVRAGEADPAAVYEAGDRIEAALEDEAHEVRANACTLAANAGIEVPADRLRTLAEEDPTERVQEMAGWALQRLHT